MFGIMYLCGIFIGLDFFVVFDVCMMYVRFCGFLFFKFFLILMSFFVSIKLLVLRFWFVISLIIILNFFGKYVFYCDEMFWNDLSRFFFISMRLILSFSKNL